MTIIDDEIWEEVGRRIKAEWGERGLAERVSWVKECLERRQYMTIFRLDSGNDTKDIDVAILRALLKGQCALLLHRCDEIACMVTLKAESLHDANFVVIDDKVGTLTTHGFQYSCSTENK